MTEITVDAGCRRYLLQWQASSVLRVFGEKTSIQRLRRSKVVAHGVALMILETSHRSHLRKREKEKKKKSKVVEKITVPFIRFIK